MNWSIKMARLFQRSYRLVLGTSEYTNNLHITFNIEKSLSKTPNTATITAINLRPEVRETIEKNKHTPVKLEAGYGDDLHLVFLGEARSAYSETNGPDIITKIEGADGERQMQTARVALPVAPKTSPQSVLQSLAGLMGLGLGNTAGAGLTGNLFPTGKVYTGSAADAMTSLTASANKSWSVQDGKVQVIDKKAPLPGLVVELSSDSGLVGSPTVDSKGVVTATSLFLPNMKPGALIVFKTRSINGGYRLQKATYSGDYAGKDWYVKIEATAVH